MPERAYRFREGSVPGDQADLSTRRSDRGQFRKTAADPGLEKQPAPQASRASTTNS